MASFYEDRPWLKTYPEWMPASIPASSATVLGDFRSVCSQNPQSPCVCYFDKVYTYGEIHNMAAALAAGLKKAGVGKADRVIFDMQNIPQAVFAPLAVWMLGAIAVPLNPMYTARELRYYMDDSGAKTLICQDDMYEAMVAWAVELRGDITVFTTSPLDLVGVEDGCPLPAQLGRVRKSRPPGTHDLMTVVRDNWGAETDFFEPGPRDLAYLVYTSGTTGAPKGAMISHGNIVHNSRVYQEACRLDTTDAVLGVAPLFHITGIVAHLGIAFHLGIPLILCHRFDAGDVLRLIEKYRATFTVAAITVYIALLSYPDLHKFDISHFKKAYSGGAPVSPSTVDRFKELLGLRIHNVYGLTESCSPATITPLGLDGPVDPASGALSVGLVVPGHEAWIVDLADPSREVPSQGEGELVLRGPGIFSGYWNKPEETARAIRDGRFFTGDIAKIDAAGWCYVVDRKKDLINVSGFKVWPREVEDVLYGHPAVKEAAVVGVADPYRGETVKAFVSLRDEYKRDTGPEQLLAFCREQLAAYKRPHVVEIISEIPKTATGKVLRRNLR